MASNALSPRRGFKPRPDVCKTLPNPGRCEPPEPPEPPDITCAFDPAGFNVDAGATQELGLRACAAHLPPGEDYIAVLGAEAGSLEWTLEQASNCEGGTVDYNAPDEPGVYLLTAHFRFSDGSTCQCEAVATVEEESNNGNDEE